MNNQSIIAASRVKELIPQKFPFDMVDGLFCYKEEAVETSFLIRKDNLFIENGKFNESGMIENIAQSIALHTSYGYFLRKEKAPIGYIGTVDNVEAFCFPSVNTTIRTHVRIIKEFMGITLIEGCVISDGKVCLKAKMKTFIS